MASDTQICNLALLRLGAASITSLTDNTPEAKLCNILFDDMVDEVIMEGSWSSTIKRVALVKTTNTPAYGFTDEFQLPTSPFCLKVLEINEATTGTYDFRIEGDKLLANVSTVSIKYVARLTNTGEFDPMLKRAIVSRLAAELAYPITGSQSVTKDMFALYKQHVQEGLAIDGTQGSGDQTITPDLHEVR
jgi:hypothetical protein